MADSDLRIAVGASRSIGDPSFRPFQNRKSLFAATIGKERPSRFKEVNHLLLGANSPEVERPRAEFVLIPVRTGNSTETSDLARSREWFQIGHGNRYERNLLAPVLPLGPVSREVTSALSLKKTNDPSEMNGVHSHHSISGGQ